ncbi:MAG: hypothetical protein AAB263_20595 [Planctomycetota bacterium]
MIPLRFISAPFIALLIVLGSTSPLHADQWEFDIYIKAVKEGAYKDDLTAVAKIIGVSEQELFDKYVAKNFRIEVVLRAWLFAQELHQDLPVVLKQVTYYAEGNSKRWRKYYKDADVPSDVIERVTKQFDELAKDACKIWLVKDAEEKAARAAARAEEDRLSKIPPDPRLALLVNRVSHRTRLTVGATRNIVEGMVSTKGGFTFEEAAEAAVFAAVTGHTEQKFRTEMTAERRGKLLDSLCTAFPPSAEDKQVIVAISTLIKAELQHPDVRNLNPPEILEETARMREVAAIIARATEVNAAAIIALFRQAEGEEDVARMCVVAKITGKNISDIMRTLRAGGAIAGWYQVCQTYDLIERVEPIMDGTFAILTTMQKTLNPKSTFE